MENTSSHLPPTSLDIGNQFQQAVSHHQAGRHSEAAEIYREILQVQPRHPDVNHNMGVLQVQQNQAAAALPYFMVALGADPSRGQFWLSYIDALIRTNQVQDAKETLALTRKQGLEGKSLDDLAARLQLLEQQATQQSATTVQMNKETPVSALNTASSSLQEPSIEHLDTLSALLSHGQIDKAENLARAMTVRFPNHWAGWKMLGVVFSRKGQNEQALFPMQRAAQLLPNDAEAHNNLGITLQSLEKTKAAETSYRRALQLNENYAEANNNLGSLLQKKGELKESESCYRRALKINPSYVKALKNMAVLLGETCRIDEAKSSYETILTINPDDVEALTELGTLQQKAGRLEESEVLHRRVLQIDPNLGAAHFNLGNVLFSSGKLKEAHEQMQIAVQLKPDFAEAHCELGSICQKLCQNDLAVTHFTRALQINPELAEANSNLGMLLYDAKMHTDAEIFYRRALRTKPEHALIHNNLGVLLHDLGRLEEAEAHFRTAIKLNPDYAGAYSNLIFSLCQDITSDESTMAEIYHRFDERFVINADRQTLTNSKIADRHLHIGFVSGDLRNHAVASFIEPLLAALSKFPDLTLHAYHNNVIEDEVSRRLKQYFAHWHAVSFLSDPALAEKISNEHIDILIDLSGHSAKNRLLTFAKRPAPIQMSWLGCPISTGMSAMDYFLADHYMLPVGKMEEQFIEKIIRLPAHAPFLPVQDAPSVNPLPALTNGHLTFGSFNRASKINQPVIARWSKLLRALPDARMLLGGVPVNSTVMLTEWFASENIDKGRLEFYPHTNTHDYLSLHHKVDFALDTFPYNGATVALNAVHMGVPTLTVAGDTTVGRLGSAIMQHLGLDEFVARNESDFVEKGKAWQNDLEKLAGVRANMRNRFSHSAIADTEGIAAALVQACRIAWQCWCTDGTQASIDVSDTQS